jgi:broad specificity phosphatase PhoE
MHTANVDNGEQTVVRSFGPDILLQANMTELILIRHGETDWNWQGRWQGQADPPLNETGRAQAQQTAKELCQFHLDALYSSDLRRAHETAEIISATLGLAVINEPRVREIDLGAWQGMLSLEIQAEYPDLFRQWHLSPLTTQPPGGENIAALAVRVTQAVNEIAARHPNAVVGVVAHELPIAIVRCRAAGEGLENVRAWIPPNGAWIRVPTLDFADGPSL